MTEDAGVRRPVTIINQRGLHARAAARLAKLAEGFECNIMVHGNGLSVSALSIMGLMLLGAGPGTIIEISATGAQAEAGVTAVIALVEARFDED